MMIDSPLAMPGLLARMGPLAVVEWSGHMAAMATYTAADLVLSEPLRALADSLGPRERHQLLCQIEAWKFGAGLDYTLDDYVPSPPATGVSGEQPCATASA
ncbi:hypothetical protein T492DRAFT_886045 [Pavlovales sp. CCMP2436]|nr:hypothetical protein T492DRAFT_886045 [Pavlovales sp. CCMP2436]